MSYSRVVEMDLNKRILKKIFICTCKASLRFLIFNDKISKFEIPIVSTCNYCAIRKAGTTNYVLSTGDIACYVWRQAIETLSIFNIDNESWKVKFHHWL